MEDFERHFTESELSAELERLPSELDFDYLLKRAGNLRLRGFVYDFALHELRRVPGAGAAEMQASAEYYGTHGDDSDERWWICARMNELLGQPLKLNGLPDWDRPR